MEPLKLYHESIVIWIQPDLILCDFDTKVGALIADELIQWELNTPGMADMFFYWGISGVFDPTNSKVCCGMLCISQPFKHWMISKLYAWIAKDHHEFAYSYNRRVVMFNSFWGLDDAKPLPPNWHMTGPINLP